MTGPFVCSACIPPTEFGTEREWHNHIRVAHAQGALSITEGQGMTLAKARSRSAMEGVLRLLREPPHAETDHEDVWVLTRRERNAVLKYFRQLQEAID